MQPRLITMSLVLQVFQHKQNIGQSENVSCWWRKMKSQLITNIIKGLCSQAVFWGGRSTEVKHLCAKIKKCCTCILSPWQQYLDNMTLPLCSLLSVFYLRLGHQSKEDVVAWHDVEEKTTCWILLPTPGKRKRVMVTSPAPFRKVEILNLKH